MMKAYQMQGVEQTTTTRAGNHLPPDVQFCMPAQVAPIKSSQPSRRHTCQQLGICQCNGPQCMDAESDLEGVAIHHYLAEPYGDTLYWGVVIFIATLTCGVVGGIAGVLYSTFGG